MASFHNTATGEKMRTLNGVFLNTRGINKTARFILLACLFLSGCATTPLDKARKQFRQGHPEEAIATLENPDSHSNRSLLLFFMNKGLIFHRLGQYENSAREFLRASKLIQSQDYISLSEQTTTLLSNDWLADYKGEYSERLWVHSYQMMNYLLLGQYQSAAVEARQALKELEKHPQALQQDWFTRVLIGLSFESVGKINDAYIVYKKLALDRPDDTSVARQLHWYAQRLGLSKDKEKYKALVPQKLRALNPSKMGELIIFFSHGYIPQKVSGEIYAPPDIRISFPRYQDSMSLSPALLVQSAGKDIPFTAIATNLGTVARASLDARGKAIFAKHAIRIGVKHSVVHSLRKNDEAAAELLNILFFLLENADTRGWDTLPGNLVMLRIPLKPGTHNVVVSTKHNPIQEDTYALDNLSIRPGQRLYRTLPPP